MEYHNYRDLSKQLFLFSALIWVPYAIASIAPWLVLIGSVSWNLLSF